MSTTMILQHVKFSLNFLGINNIFFMLLPKKEKGGRHTKVTGNP